jgi:hypothetical protein
MSNKNTPERRAAAKARGERFAQMINGIRREETEKAVQEKVAEIRGQFYEKFEPRMQASSKRGKHKPLFTAFYNDTPPDEIVRTFQACLPDDRFKSLCEAFARVPQVVHVQVVRPERKPRVVNLRTIPG